MKKITFIIYLTLLTSAAFSQQFLWTTSKDTTFKSMLHIPVENVFDKVLEFYDQYQFYYDGTGYSKDGFIKMLEKSQSFERSKNSWWTEFKKKIYQIRDLTVFALKDNLGHGSVILIISITKENVDILSFSNNYEKDAIAIYPFEKEKFKKWIRTFIPAETNQEVTNSNIEKNELQVQDEKDKIFTKVEKEAEFPGGNAAWARYVQRSLGSFDAGENGAPAGKYQVIVRFVVSKEGTVNDVQAETNYGYGMEEMAIKIIKESPNWKPALQNGRNVNAYRRQPITFTVGAKN